MCGGCCRALPQESCKALGARIAEVKDDTVDNQLSKWLTSDKARGRQAGAVHAVDCSCYPGGAPGSHLLTALTHGTHPACYAGACESGRSPPRQHPNHRGTERQLLPAGRNTAADALDGRLQEPPDWHLAMDGEQRASEHGSASAELVSGQQMPDTGRCHDCKHARLLHAVRRGRVQRSTPPAPSTPH